MNVYCGKRKETTMKLSEAVGKRVENLQWVLPLNSAVMHQYVHHIQPLCRAVQLLMLPVQQYFTPHRRLTNLEINKTILKAQQSRCAFCCSHMLYVV